MSTPPCQLLKSKRPQIIKIRATPRFYLSRLFISTGKMYTTSDLRSISHVHAVFALPSVPGVFFDDSGCVDHPDWP